LKITLKSGTQTLFLFFFSMISQGLPKFLFSATLKGCGNGKQLIIETAFCD